MKATHAFSNEPNQHLWYRVVERFKLRLRDALEKKIKQKGGVTHAIIREAFLNWDADASGKLDPAELVRKLSIFFCRRKAMAPNFLLSCLVSRLLVARPSRLLIYSGVYVYTGSPNNAVMHYSGTPQVRGGGFGKSGFGTTALREPNKHGQKHFHAKTME